MYAGFPQDALDVLPRCFDLPEGLVVDKDVGGKGDVVVGHGPEMNVVDVHDVG